MVARSQKRACGVSPSLLRCLNFSDTVLLLSSLSHAFHGASVACKDSYVVCAFCAKPWASAYRRVIVCEVCKGSGALGHEEYSIGEKSCDLDTVCAGS